MFAVMTNSYNVFRCVDSKNVIVIERDWKWDVSVNLKSGRTGRCRNVYYSSEIIISFNIRNVKLEVIG